MSGSDSRIGSGRPGAIRAAIRREYGTDISSVRGVLIERTAALVDRAIADGDGRLMLAAQRELRQLIGKDSAGSDDSDDGRAEILQLLGRDATVGDSA